MFVTQSAVSHSIKALEKSLDQQLLDRAGKTIALTAEGEALLKRADRILEEMRLATEDLKAIRHWGYGRLRVGCTDTTCQYLLPSVLREFRESFPNCEVSILSADTHDLLAMLSHGEIDIAIGIKSSAEESGFHFRPLFQDQLVFAVSPLHPWAEGKVDPQESLDTNRYIVYAKKSPTSQLVARYFRRTGLHAPSTTELGNMEAIKELAKIGLGVGVIAPWVMAGELERGTLVAIDPPGQEPLSRSWGVFMRGGGDSLSISTETFLGICATVARNF